jgi:hypothetical protein
MGHYGAIWGILGQFGAFWGILGQVSENRVYADTYFLKIKHFKHFKQNAHSYHFNCLIIFSFF